jgi:hypothetical protein
VREHVTQNGKREADLTQLLGTGECERASRRVEYEVKELGDLTQRDRRKFFFAEPLRELIPVHYHRPTATAHVDRVRHLRPDRWPRRRGQIRRLFGDKQGMEIEGEDKLSL